MNYNILSYLIYGCITIYIIWHVGSVFHKNGRVFILQLFQGNEAMTDTTNNILLLAYYLFNIGYAVLQFSYWETVTGVNSLVSSISVKAGTLILILAVMHYCNLALIYFLSHVNNHFITHKNIQS